MSQRDLILQHLQTGQGITQMGALERFGCMRLGARINELRNQGYPIHSETVKANNKSFSRYSMAA